MSKKHDSVAYGSGCFFTTDGYFVTAAHTIIEPENTYIYHNSVLKKCIVSYLDKRLDICVLWVNTTISKKVCTCQMKADITTTIQYYENNNNTLHRYTGQITSVHSVTNNMFDNFTFSLPIPYGASGCPVFQNDKIVGMITQSNTTRSFGVVSKIFMRVLAMFSRNLRVVSRYTLNIRCRHITLEHVVSNNLQQLTQDVHGELVYKSFNPLINEMDIILEINGVKLYNSSSEFEVYFSPGPVRLKLLQFNRTKNVYNTSCTTLSSNVFDFPDVHDKPLLNLNNFV